MTGKCGSCMNYDHASCPNFASPGTCPCAEEVDSEITECDCCEDCREQCAENI